MRLLCILIAIGLALGADTPRADEAATQMTLEGKWRIVAIDCPSGAMEREGDITFVGGNATWGNFADYRLYPESNPRAIDWTERLPGFDRCTFQGIYTIRGDTLIVCLNLGDTDERPTEFKTHPGKSFYLITLKRCHSRLDGV